MGYRKSKDLDNRYPRYAKHGSLVMGHVEDNGEWLRISTSVFLPMKVGAIQIMEPTSSASNDAKRWGTNGNPSSARWWTCDLGNQGDPSELTTANGSKDTDATQSCANQ